MSNVILEFYDPAELAARKAESYRISRDWHSMYGFELFYDIFC